METIPFLTKEDVAALDSLLMHYLEKTSGTLTLVIDKGGTIIAQQGEIESIDIVIVSALAAGSFAATKELARRIGENEFSALYHQGVDRHIFMAALDEHTVIVTVFGDRTTIGLVRLFTVNVAAQLRTLLNQLRQRDGLEPKLVLEEDLPVVGENIFG